MNSILFAAFARRNFSWVRDKIYSIVSPSSSNQACHHGRAHTQPEERRRRLHASANQRLVGPLPSFAAGQNFKSTIQNMAA